MLSRWRNSWQWKKVCWYVTQTNLLLSSKIKGPRWRLGYWWHCWLMLKLDRSRSNFCWTRRIFAGGDIIRSQHSCSHRTRQEAGKQREADCGMSYPDIAMRCGFRRLDWPVHCGFRLFIRARGSDTYRRRCSRIWGRKLKLCSQSRWTKLQLWRLHRE